MESMMAPPEYTFDDGRDFGGADVRPELSPLAATLPKSGAGSGNPSSLLLDRPFDSLHLIETSANMFEQL